MGQEIGYSVLLRATETSGGGLFESPLCDAKALSLKFVPLAATLRPVAKSPVSRVFLSPRVRVFLAEQHQSAHLYFEDLIMATVASAADSILTLIRLWVVVTFSCRGLFFSPQLIG